MLISAFLCSDHWEHVVKTLRSNNESVQELNITFSVYKHKCMKSRHSLSTVKQLKVSKSSNSPQTRSKMRALLLLCTVGIVIASVIDLTSARNIPQGYNARAPARSMEENDDECTYVVIRHSS